VKPIVEHIRPREWAVFHGWIDPQKINWIEKWSVEKLVKKPFGDFRDWDMIVNWTTQIASAVKETELSPVA
jgi:menaquinone-dependent protoporphyrinogen IX oxidase